MGRIDYKVEYSTATRCLDPCPYGQDSRVGSTGCIICEHNQGYGGEDNWIDCKLKKE